MATLCRWTLPTLILLGLLTGYRLGFGPAPAPAIDTTREAPWQIEPLHNEPRMVTDGQLQQILPKVVPPRETNTNTWIHALRLWGPDAEFADATVPSGYTLQQYFLDDRSFRQFAGDQAPPLFVIRQDGTVAVRSYDDDYDARTSSSYHQNDLLATMAETGVTLDTPLTTRTGRATVGDLARGAMQDFHLDQHEYEWGAISYARYVHPARWINKYGQRLDAEAIVGELMSHPLPLGPCNGLHRLEAMVVLWRADELARQNAPDAAGLLSARTRRRMLATMHGVGRMLVASQDSQGSWNRQWPKGAAAEHDGTSLDERILVTGHHLEWLALAPEQVLPPRENLVRAGQWLTRTLIEVDDKKLQSRYGPFSHAARALCLWRGHEAVGLYQAEPPAPTPER